MVVIRCCQCGNTIHTWKQVNVTGYQEKLSDKPCIKCRGKVSTTESKLLKAIFGGN